MTKAGLFGTGLYTSCPQFEGLLDKLGDRGKTTGVWPEHCQACSVPEIAGVFNRSGIPYDFVTGYLEDETTWSEIKSWIEAARVAASMRNNRLGVLGHYCGGMLDVYTDLSKQSATFSHLEPKNICISGQNRMPLILVSLE